MCRISSFSNVLRLHQSPFQTERKAHMHTSRIIMGLWKSMHVIQLCNVTRSPVFQGFLSHPPFSLCVSPSLPVFSVCGGPGCVESGEDSADRRRAELVHLSPPGEHYAACRVWPAVFSAESLLPPRSSVICFCWRSLSLNSAPVVFPHMTVTCVVDA